MQVKQALASVSFRKFQSSRGGFEIRREPSFEQILLCEHFELWRIRSQKEYSVGSASTPHVLVCVSGAGSVSHGGTWYPFGKGEVVLLPPALGACTCLAKGALVLDIEYAMDKLQFRLYAAKKQSLLICLQAPDAGGKDGVVRHVIVAMNPQGCRVQSFKQPTPLELEHDFLWRIERQVPRRGEVVIFNWSQYEDVLIVRVHDLVPEKVWSARYEQINEFEKRLVDNGTHILKFFLHVSKEEQLERFKKRLDDPDRHWKLKSGTTYADPDLAEGWIPPCGKTKKSLSVIHIPETLAVDLEAWKSECPNPAPEAFLFANQAGDVHRHGQLPQASAS